jgi:hypothetical protein
LVGVSRKSRRRLRDETNRDLISAYPVKRPDGDWSLMIINKDPTSAHQVKITFDKDGKETQAHFDGVVKYVTFGAAEYVWHSSESTSHADPDGPPKRGQVDWTDGHGFLLPRASITVLTGKVEGL